MNAIDTIFKSVDTANTVIGILFAAFYAYQIFFIIVPLIIRYPKLKEQPLRKYGILISARNESLVVGNLIDRVFQGYVIDYFEFLFMDFAIFNVADVYVCVGVGLYAIYTFYTEFYKKEKS